MDMLKFIRVYVTGEMEVPGGDLDREIPLSQNGCSFVDHFQNFEQKVIEFLKFRILFFYSFGFLFFIRFFLFLEKKKED